METDFTSGGSFGILGGTVVHDVSCAASGVSVFSKCLGCGAGLDDSERLAMARIVPPPLTDGAA